MAANIITLSLGQHSLSTLLLISLGLPWLSAASPGSSTCRSMAWLFGVSDTSGHTSQQTISYLPTQSSQKSIFWSSYLPHLTTRHWASLFSFVLSWQPDTGLGYCNPGWTRNRGIFFWIAFILWVRIYIIRFVMQLLYCICAKFFIHLVYFKIVNLGPRTIHTDSQAPRIFTQCFSVYRFFHLNRCFVWVSSNNTLSTMTNACQVLFILVVSLVWFNAASG